MLELYILIVLAIMTNSDSDSSISEESIPSWRDEICDLCRECMHLVKAIVRSIIKILE